MANAPDDYYESLNSYKQTFARVVPTSGEEAKAQIQEIHRQRHRIDPGARDDINVSTQAELRKSADAIQQQVALMGGPPAEPAK